MESRNSQPFSIGVGRRLATWLTHGWLHRGKRWSWQLIRSEASPNAAAGAADCISGLGYRALPRSVRPSPRCRWRRQRGVVLVLAALPWTLLLGTALLGLVPSLWTQGGSSERTVAALSDAKAALLGYAASYADQHESGAGPGYLPCPDVDGDGSPDPACPRDALGLLPWRRLGVAGGADAITTPLWYAVADPFRANPRKFVPLNGSVTSPLSIGSRNRLAAVVMAPGPLWDGSFPSGFGAPISASAASFALPPLGPGSTAVTLSVEEVVRAAESRVITELRRVLSRYKAASWNPDGAYPWLRPMSVAVPHRARVGALVGHLPVHSAGAAFTTGFELQWSDAGLHAARGRGSIGSGASEPLVVAVAESNGRCLWVDHTVFVCVGSAVDEPVAGRVRRYDCEVRLARVGQVAISAPTSSAVRRRGLRVREKLPVGTSLSVVLSEYGSSEDARARANATGEITFSAQAGDSISLGIDGVAFGVAAGEEIPQWFVDHDWHRQLLLTLDSRWGPGTVGMCVTDLAGCTSPQRSSPIESGLASNPPSHRTVAIGDSP